MEIKDLVKKLRELDKKYASESVVYNAEKAVLSADILQHGEEIFQKLKENPDNFLASNQNISKMPLLLQMRLKLQMFLPKKFPKIMQIALIVFWLKRKEKAIPLKCTTKKICITLHIKISNTGLC